MNFEQSIENYEDLDDIIKEDVKNYMLTLINANNWLDKRLSSSFSRNPWLLNYISKEDLKQDFYLNIYKPKTISGLMKRIGVDRVKYMNSVFSNVLLGNLEKHFGRATYPLNEDLEVSENNVSSFEEKQNLTDLFLDETLEKTVVSMMRDGLTNKEIMEQLELSRRSFENIKKDIRRKIEESESD